MAGDSPLLLTLAEDTLGWSCGAWDDTKGTRRGSISSFSLPRSLSWVGAASQLGGMGEEVCVLRCLHYFWSSL